ncbi:venom serine protease 34-like [Athalia rosae]|uniref:venom serine protease 34-like n=1 Tax=Athalia rosae TaxID=37344 RepID=UPI0020339909|nr:venom serine protease 34-like [Athalia rosae]
MTKFYLALAALAVALPTPIFAIDANCDYYQVVQPGVKYYVFNSEYPNRYTSARSCRWYARSPTKVKLTCSVFSLPASSNCVRDRVAISPSGDLQLADAHNYCGTGTFSITSDNHDMNIVFTSLFGTAGGRFYCTLEATTVNPTCNCGWKKQTRIVGGVRAGVNEFPMVAALIDLSNRLLFCGSTIISEKYVLTAAHCLFRQQAGNIAVLVGDHDTSTGADTSASSIHQASNIIIHPAYNSETQANDIGIVTVVDTIVYTMEVGPACLPFRFADTDFTGSIVDVLGWGTLEFAGPTSNVLQKVKLNITSLTSCRRSFPEVTTNQVCTYTRGKDACQFDSGGALLWQNPNTMRLVGIGVVSYGLICADTTPGVNTRVGAYMNWILSVTPGADYCRVE